MEDGNKKQRNCMFHKSEFKSITNKPVTFRALTDNAQIRHDSTQHNYTIG